MRVVAPPNPSITMLYRKSSYLKVFAQGLRKVSRKRIKKCRASPQGHAQGHAQGPCARPMRKGQITKYLSPPPSQGSRARLRARLPRKAFCARAQEHTLFLYTIVTLY